jgi:hypothetical protein
MNYQNTMPQNTPENATKTVCKIRKKIDKKINKINRDNIIMSNTEKMNTENTQNTQSTQSNRKKAREAREHKKLYKKVLKQLCRRAIQQEKERKKIIERLSKYCAKWVLDDCPFYTYENSRKWTIADLFIRQKLNNCCDGFGMKNVWRVYKFLCLNKQVLIKHKMVSEKAWNNSGYLLWCEYGYDKCLKTGYYTNLYIMSNNMSHSVIPSTNFQLQN